MSYANKTRSKVADIVLIVGSLLLLAGVYWDSAFGIISGFMFLCVGATMFASLSIIEGVPGFMRLLSRQTEPGWEGEILYTDAGEYKIRYEFDAQGQPWFVARDVCVAIGVPAPIRKLTKWGGVPLLKRGEHACFSEAHVQAYLIPLAIKSDAANRLLVNIRNNVLRKLESRRT